jgi:hypothetical protein
LDWVGLPVSYLHCFEFEGDVIPDHPHMLILMFWLVIIGLSIVSMLLSVIQIKMEEWLYHLLIKMQVGFGFDLRRELEMLDLIFCVEKSV